MGAVGFATLAFNKSLFVQQNIVCQQQTRPFILRQDSSIRNCVGCQWTTRGTKGIKVKQIVIMEVIEPEAGKFFQSGRESVYPQALHCDPN